MWKKCLVYIDDIIIFSTNFNDHLLALGEVFTALKKANLRVKPEKCHFLQSEVTFLGHVLSENGIRPDPSKTRDVLEFPVPHNVNTLQKFLGLVQWFRKFIKDLAFIAKLLFTLLRQDVKFEWTEVHQSAFEQLKGIFTTPPSIAVSSFYT